MTSAMLIVRVFSQVCCSAGLVDSGLGSCEDSVTAITHTENHLIISSSFLRTMKKKQNKLNYELQGKTKYSSHNKVSDRLIYLNLIPCWKFHTMPGKYKRRVAILVSIPFATIE